jgi:hypothetical protein
MSGLAWLMANTWFHSGLTVPETSRPGRDRMECGPTWTFTYGAPSQARMPRTRTTRTKR